jgi:hypothetical protein
MDRLSAVAFVVTVAPSVSPVHAAEDARKVSVVSFGLFGDQGVFRSEATSVAQVVADRFGSGPKLFRQHRTIATNFADFAQVSFRRKSRRDLLIMSITARDPNRTIVPAGERSATSPRRR